MAKHKVITFEEQLKLLEENHGVPSADAMNVFTKFKLNMEDIIGKEADANNKSFELQTVFGSYGFEWQDAAQRINSADGVAYEAPAHYAANFAFPRWAVDVSNKNVDFSAVPTAADIAKSKAA